MRKLQAGRIRGKGGERVSNPVRVGHYELLEPIGEGGMGVVYRARDPRLGRVVAIKFLAGAASLDPGRRARFLREARAEAALSHPNIATVLDVGESELDHPHLAPTSGGWGETPLPRIPYLVLEYVPGTDLRTRLRQGPLPPVEAVQVARQIAAGLAAAHAAGIVHRDLKPANIRRTPEGLIKILDFGLARFLASASPTSVGETEMTTREGVVLGTVPYMAPEQAAGMAVDARGDLFALGVILFELVTGRVPFRGDSTMALLRAVLNDAPERLAPAAVGCPPRYAALVERLLAKRPEDRPDSAAEVLRELDEIARDAEAQRTSVSRVSQLSYELSRAVAAGRKSPRVSLVAGLVLGVTAAAALLLWPRLRAGEDGGAPVSLQQLAVLPFANATGDEALDYVAEGLSSALVGQLAAVPGLSVAGQSETRRYRDGVASARDVARDLGVGAVLEATLRRDGAGLALDAALTDGATGRVFWSRALATPQEELAGLSAQLAAAATEALSVPLNAEDRDRLARDPTGSAVAFDFYLRGRGAMEDFDDPQSFRIAAGLFQRAAELDPQFALAFAGQARALALAWEQERDPELLDRAERAAQRALALDRELPETRLAVARLHVMRGRPREAIALLEPLSTSGRAVDILHRELALAWEAAGDAAKSEEHLLATVAARPASWQHWNVLGDFRLRAGNYAGARSAFERAKSLAPPGNTIPDENLAALLLYEGETERALAAYEAIGDSSNATSASNLGTLYYFNGRLNDAERAFRRAVRMAPREARFRRNLADTLLRLGREAEARDEFEQALALTDEQLRAAAGDQDLRIQRTLYLARVGRCDEATAEANRLERELPTSPQLLRQLARPPALCGAPEAAMERLRRAVGLGLIPASLADEDELAALRGRRDFRQLVGAPAGP